MKVKVGVSGRHIHLTKETLEKLYGKGKTLEKLRSISQPNQYQSTDRLMIKTDKSSFESVSILGPLRDFNQIEISITDAIKLGISPPIRLSGNVKTSSLITLIGPKEQITIEGCIIAKRHIHMPFAIAKKYDFYNGQIVKVKVDGIRSGIMDNVEIRVGDYVLELHIDTDEANGFNLKNNDEVEIIKE